MSVITIHQFPLDVHTQVELDRHTNYVTMDCAPETVDKPNRARDSKLIAPIEEPLQSKCYKDRNNGPVAQKEVATQLREVLVHARNTKVTHPNKNTCTSVLAMP